MVGRASADPTAEPAPGELAGGSATWKRPRLYEWYFSRTPYGVAIRRQEERGVMAMVDEVLQDGQSVVELGAGTGHYTMLLAPRTRHVLALDASPAMVTYLAERVAREQVRNVRAQLGAAPAPVAGAGVHDGALAVGVLNYLPDLADALRWLAGLVRPGGWLVFTVPLAGPSGRVSVLTGRASKKQVHTYSPASVTEAARRAALAVERTAGAGIAGRHRTLVVRASKGGA